MWEGVYGQDAWATLAAIAVQTSRIRLGTMLTPLPRRRPWKVASEALTLDQLSGGRAILTVGLGAYDAELGLTGEQGTLRSRAERLDEGLTIVRRLWSGERVTFTGRHYTVDIPPGPTPVQEHGIPIWVVGVVGSKPSLARALRHDGLIPSSRGADGNLGQAGPSEVAEITASLDPGRRFDIVVEGETPRDDLAPWRTAGATWWLETRWGREAAFAKRVKQGPPVA